MVKTAYKCERMNEDGTCKLINKPEGTKCVWFGVGNTSCDSMRITKMTFYGYGG